MMKLTYIVPKEDAGRTLRDLLTKRLRLSTGQRRAAQAAGGVTVNAAFCFAAAPLPAGARIEVALPQPPPMDVPLEHGPLAVLYEDEALLAVDKPAGLLVHPSHAQYTGTLLSRVLGHLGHSGQPLCAHPVHRLDRGTSGIVLFAKHPHIQALMMNAMQKGTFEKRYEALALGTFPSSEGTIDEPIARACADGQRREIRIDGQPAHTRYRVLGTLCVGGQTISHIGLSPVTGRTHQLRVHCLSVGCPLLGDRLYHTPASLLISGALGLNAQMLRAVALYFSHPLTGEAIQLACKGLCTDFQ